MSPRLLLPLLLATSLAACSRSPEPPPAAAPAAGTAPQTAIGRQVEAAMAEARKELNEGNLGLNSGFLVNGSGREARPDLPKGEITPQGDLLIEGKPVAVDAAQRALLLDYRRNLIAVAEAGMAMGVRGADLGMRAAGDAIKGIFTGNTEALEAKVQAEAAQLEAEAQALCQLLPPLLASERALAAALPAFAPYARMDQADVDDCGRSLRNDAKRAEVRAEVRQGIREAIRGAVRAPSGQASQQSEAEAEQAQATADAASKAAGR